MGTENIKIDFDGLFNMILEEETESSKNSLRILKRPAVKEVNKRQSTETEESPTFTEEEQRLANVLIGDKGCLIKELALAVGEEDKESEKEDNTKRKPAWQDSDEECNVRDVIKGSKRVKYKTEESGQKSYTEFLRNRYNQFVPQPKWAHFDRELESDSDDELLKTVGHLGQSNTAALPSTNISMKRLKDLNRENQTEGAITSIQFHPTSTAALVASYSGLASIFAIDGKRNEKLHSIKFRKFPIRCARIFRSGTEALFGASRNFFYSYDLLKAEETRIVLPKGITSMRNFELSQCGKYFAIAGRYGEIHLMDLRSKELIHTYIQQYPCRALQFSNDSIKLVTHSSGPEVNVFDIRKERIEHTFLDEGCICGKALSISPDGNMIATGSNEGVVNIYNYDNVFLSQSPRPLKSVYNLTTSISTIKFNHSSEILGITSDVVPAAVKLIHLPSATVFANFPGLRPHLGQVGVLEFSPNSGFMALGSKVKLTPLFRLGHYGNY